jgi:heme/copper-type cytochrome/quinol oxidase subunit 2
MNTRWLLTVPVVTAILGAAVFLAIESGGGGPAEPSSGTQPVNTGATSVPVKVCVADIEGLWRYTYGSTCGARNAPSRLPYSYHDLVLPAETRVDLVRTADRGQHALRISDLGLTIDAKSAAPRQITFRTRGSGKTYQAVCPKNCGYDRASASADVIVVTAAGYSKWLTTQAHAIARQRAQTSQLRTDLIDEGVFARSVAVTTR